MVVYTQSDFENAIRNRQSEIIVGGELAQRIIEKYEAKKRKKRLGIALAIASIAAIPFTGGTSLALMGLTIGTVTISATELAILCGFILGLTGILKGAEIEFRPDGTVVVKPKYKD